MVEIFRSVIGNPTLEIRSDMHRRNVSGWDSMAHIQLILAVESQFGIKFTAGEIAKLTTVGQLSELIGAKAT